MQTGFGIWKRLCGRLLAVVAVGLSVAGCNVSASESGAASSSLNQPGTPATGTTASITATTAAAPLPDSLALTPVAPLVGIPEPVRQAVRQLHAQLGFAAAGLRPDVLERACIGYLTLRRAGRIQRGGVLAVADMDLPSSQKRLWVLDLRHSRVLHRSHVAHGRGSGRLRARRFSNVLKSACTALGFYCTQDTYGGSHGLSRRLRGLDKGQNDNALRRYVVLHAADYVSRQHLQRHGQVGYSRGCPALPPDQYRAIIQSLPEGACLLLAGPGLESKWLDGAAAAQQLAGHGWE